MILFMEILTILFGLLQSIPETIALDQSSNANIATSTPRTPNRHRHRQLHNDTDDHTHESHEDGSLKFNEATFLSSHNSHANRDSAQGNFFALIGINQDNSIYHQLASNEVRALLVDIKVDGNNTEPLRLVHGDMDYGGFSSELEKNVIPFLEENDTAIVSVMMQTDESSDSSQVLGYLQGALLFLTANGVSLKDMTFKYHDPLWANHVDWPTLDEIRLSGQRLFFFTDRLEIANADYGIMYDQHAMMENDWDGIDDCTSRYEWGRSKVSFPSNTQWSRLFRMNHFCCDFGSESYPRTVGEDLIGGGDNGWGILYPRIETCIAGNGGIKPNFIVLDWVFQNEEALEVIDYLNFGGALGTGQACEEDSHCATSSCNVESGVCQCQKCPSNDPDVCAGCVEEEYCFSFDDERMNECRDKDRHEDSFYCGEEYFETIEKCNESVKCPNGNDDCPEGLVCFAGVDCPEPPSEAPSIFPTFLPSISPSSPAPTTRSPIMPTEPTGAPTVTATTRSPMMTMGPTQSPTDEPTVPNRNFCGKNYLDARDTCQTGTACPEPFANDICRPLNLTCFANIFCPPPPPTPPPSAIPTSAPIITTIPPSMANSTNSSLAASDKPVVQTSSPQPSLSLFPSSPPSMSPTGAPTASPTRLITQYCGTSYENAKATCSPETSCVRGYECGAGQTCYTGLICFTKKPTKQPTVTPTTPSPTNETTVPPTTAAPVSPTPEPSNEPTKSPFNFSNKYYCGVTYAEAQANCYTGTPCPDGTPASCNQDIGENCFSGIDCFAPPTASPTTGAPSFSPVSPTESPTLRPTKAPFAFSNNFFCGMNATDAQSNCYYGIACPSGNDGECPVGTCYGGIQCTAPPTSSPTLSPVGAGTPGAAPGAPGSNPGFREPGSPSGGNQDTIPPFVWNTPSGQLALVEITPVVYVRMFAMGIGLVGLLF